jgi:hypothetical protein
MINKPISQWEIGLQTLAMFDQDQDKIVDKQDLTSKVGFKH